MIARASRVSKMEHLRRVEKELLSNIASKERELRLLEEEERKCVRSWEKYISEKSRFEAEVSHQISAIKDLSEQVREVNADLASISESPRVEIPEDMLPLLADASKFARYAHKIKLDIEDLKSVVLPLPRPQMTESEIEEANKRALEHERYLECKTMWDEIDEEILRYLGSSHGDMVPEANAYAESLRILCKKLDTDIEELVAFETKEEWREAELRKRKEELHSIEADMSKISDIIPDIKASGSVISVGDIEAASERCSSRLKDVERSISDSDISGKFLDIHSEMKELEKQVRDYEEDARAVSKLLELCDITQHEIMESKLASVNDGLFSLSSSIMEGETEMKLLCHRDVKSNHTKKAQVNLEVFSGGSSCDGVKVLSGGERARACICLLMALHQHTPFPFMFFDETMAFIGSSLKSVVLEELRRDFLYSGKGVLFVMHDGVKGLFDEEINLDEECCSAGREKY